jgi:hypothetical protein
MDPDQQDLNAALIRQNYADPTGSGSTLVNCLKFPSKYDSDAEDPDFFLCFVSASSFPDQTD